MDIGRDFTLSYEALMKNKVIALPYIIATILWVLAFAAILFSSGIIDDFKEYSALRDQFIKEKGLSVSDMNNPETSKEFLEYADASSFGWPNLKALINFKNITILIFIVVILAIISYYASALALVLVALVVAKKKWSWQIAIKLTNKIFWRYTWFYLLFIFLIFLLIIIGTIVIFVSSLLVEINKIFGILSMIAIGLIWLSLLFYAIVRLIFAFPILFLENKTAYSTLKECFAITKNRFKEVFLVFVIYAGISIAFGILGNVLFGGLESLFAGFNTIQIVIYALLVIAFYIISYFVKIFSYLFLFYSYIDFKKTYKLL